MNRLTEPAIENVATTLFERLGYSYVYVTDIAADDENPAPKLMIGEVRVVT